MEDLILWDKEAWKGLVDESRIKPPKVDLTKRATLPTYFNLNSFKEPLDFNLMVKLGEDKYSRLKVPKTLLRSLSEYFNKPTEEVNFRDLVQMYESIREIFPEKKVDYNDLRKWRKANGLKKFGPIQYDLMEKYFFSFYSPKD